MVGKFGWYSSSWSGTWFRHIRLRWAFQRQCEMVRPSLFWFHSHVIICFNFSCSLIRLTREVLPHIIKSKGTVVNVSSINGPCPVGFSSTESFLQCWTRFIITMKIWACFQFPGVTYYCMSKSAVDQFTKCLALEMAPHGVRVNAVKSVLSPFDIFGKYDFVLVLRRIFTPFLILRYQEFLILFETTRVVCAAFRNGE